MELNPPSFHLSPAPLTHPHRSLIPILPLPTNRVKRKRKRKKSPITITTTQSLPSFLPSSNTRSAAQPAINTSIPFAPTYKYLGRRTDLKDDALRTLNNLFSLHSVI